MKSISLSILVLFMVAIGFIASGCGKNGNSNNGGSSSSQEALTNSYFEEFAATNAQTKDLPQFEAGAIAPGTYALTRNNEVVYVKKAFADGRAEAEYVSYSGKAIFTDLSPRQNGTNGLFEGHYALTRSNEVVYVKKVFANGSVEAEYVSYSGKAVFTDLTPQRLGDYFSFALTKNSELVLIRKVFTDGRAEVEYVDYTGKAVLSNLMPRKDGAGGLIEGHYALTKNNEVVYLKRVFADGRAQIEYTTYSGKAILRDLVPSYSK